MSDRAPSLWLRSPTERPLCASCRAEMDLAPRQVGDDGAAKQPCDCQGGKSTPKLAASMLSSAAASTLLYNLDQLRKCEQDILRRLAHFD